MALTLERMAAEQAELLATLGLSQHASDLQDVAAVFKASAPLYRKMQALQKSDSPGDALARFLKTLHKLLSDMEPGQAVLVPAGWREKTQNGEARFDVTVVVECIAPVAPPPPAATVAATETAHPPMSQTDATLSSAAAQQRESDLDGAAAAAATLTESEPAAAAAGLPTYRVTICNTGAGLEYHPRQATLAPAKIKYVTAATIGNVPQADVLDSAFWMGALLNYAVLSTHNSAKGFYEAFPALKNEPLEASWAATRTDPATAFRSPAKANVSFYGGLREALLYLLRRRGVCGARGKALRLCYRLQMFQQMQDDLGNAAILTLSESEVHVLRMAGQQCSHATIKLSQRLSSHSHAKAHAEPNPDAGADTRADTPADAMVDANGDRGNGQGAGQHHDTGSAAGASAAAEVAASGTVGHGAAAAETLLTAVLARVTSANERILAKPCLDSNATRPPPLVDLNTGRAAGAAVAQHHPLWDHLVRSEDLTGREGAALPPVQLRAIDFLQVQGRATSLHAAVEAMRLTDHICTLTENQGELVKYGHQLKMAALQHLLFHVVPVPVGPATAQTAVGWAWNGPLTYGAQLDIVFIVQRLTEHFAAAALSHQASRSFYAVRAVGTGVLAAIADAVLRTRASDFPSAVTVALRNDAAKEPFGPSVTLFGQQCETLEILEPEIAITKTLVLDYFLVSWLMV